MKKLIFVSLMFLGLNLMAQKDTVSFESVWDQGIPFCPDNEYVTNLIEKLNLENVRDEKNMSDETKSICRDIGLAFYDMNMIEEASWYLDRSKNFHFKGKLQNFEKPEIKKEMEEPKISETDLKSMESDLNFLKSIPESFDKVSPKDLKNIAIQIENQIQKLVREKDSLLQTINPDKRVIESKENMIGSLKKDKEIVDLSIKTSDLKIKTLGLEIEKDTLKKYLTIVSIILALLFLVVMVLLQRKTIKHQDKEIEKQLKSIAKKNTYLEHAAKIIRHDMHSGINTYIPRGLTSLEKKLTNDEIKMFKLDTAIKMIKEGLNHTQRVYKNVYEFTNLVKTKVVLDKNKVDLNELLNNYLSTTSYSSQVQLGQLVDLKVNEILFCNAIDMLIKNGIKYNDNDKKLVKLYVEGEYLIIEDNGRGLTEKQFEKILNKKNISEDDGLGLNICSAILEEHGFNLFCQKIETGTKMKIKIK